MMKALSTAILCCVTALADSAVPNDRSPAASSSQEGRWKEDLEYLARELPGRHKDFSKLIPKKQFRKQVRELERELSQLSDPEIILRSPLYATGCLGESHIPDLKST